MDTYLYLKGSEFDFSAPIRRAFDVTPSTAPLEVPTRAIMLDAAATVTGSLVGDKSGTHTTHELVAGVLYPFAFYKITSVSNSAVVKGYA